MAFERKFIYFKIIYKNSIGFKKSSVSFFLFTLGKLKSK